jgi:hypothetical protein
MKKWIEETIDPPGFHKKNRGAVFSTIGKVFAVVRDDAATAVNAHFPYLADAKKLEEHGKALYIPHLINDTEEEYRERVTAASFYHMKTGERGYIKEQLAAHFQDRVMTMEEFLKIYVKVLGLTEEEKSWTYTFLDGIVDPNIGFQFISWEKLADVIRLSESQQIAIIKNDVDTISADEQINVRLKMVFTDSMARSAKYNGQWKYNGAIKYGYKAYVEHLHMEEKREEKDLLPAAENAKITIRVHACYNGKFKYDGSHTYSGIIGDYEEVL